MSQQMTHSWVIDIFVNLSENYLHFSVKPVEKYMF